MSNGHPHTGAHCTRTAALTRDGASGNGRRRVAAQRRGAHARVALVALMAVALAGLCSLSCAVRAGDSFALFLARLWPEAQAMGISRATFDRALEGVAPDLSLPDLVLPGRAEVKGQAEFTRTPAEYLNERYLARLSDQGRALLGTQGRWLEKIEHELGVQRQFVLAIWGRETAFGTEKTGYYAIRALATQAYLGRRKEMFRTELLYALKMLQEGVRTRENMVSSWAGAMGLTQFMPSEYYGLAYDLDGDGRKDIWGSIPDALASAANQLRHKGWVPGQSWGYEVTLPEGTSCLLEGPEGARPLGEWVRLGVRRTGGRPLPADLSTVQAFVLTPAGAHGPSFLALENFLVLKRYNMSDLYALFVGTLGDRIAGGGGFDIPWAGVRQLQASAIGEIQQLLQQRGYAIAKLDGKAGMNTRALIGAYQRDHGLAVDCWPTEALLTHLRARAHQGLERAEQSSSQPPPRVGQGTGQGMGQGKGQGPEGGVDLGTTIAPGKAPPDAPARRP